MVDAQIGAASGLDSIEGNLALWLDASNINYKQNAGINDGDAIAEWKDLSGNGNHGVQSATGKQPVVSTTLLNNQPLIEFDGVDDYFNST